MGDRDQKPIEELKRGDRILSFNFETNKNEESIVEKVQEVTHYDMVAIKVGDSKIVCTIDHPFMGESSWLSYYPKMTNEYYHDFISKEYKEGMKLQSLYGMKKIESILYYGEYTLTYQITKLSRNKVYYANTLMTTIEEL